jgi:hypothetical protein
MRKLLMVAAAAAIALVGLSAAMCEDDKDDMAAPADQSGAPADSGAPTAAPAEPDQPAQ